MGLLGPAARRFQEREAEVSFIRNAADWRWWVTVTFSACVTRERALRTHREWMTAIARDQAAHVIGVFVIEEERDVRPHVHALFGGVEEPLHIGRGRLRALLRAVDPLAGFERMAGYDRSRGAAGYIAGKVEPREWLTACPRARRCRRRGRGCVVGRHMW